MTLPHPFTNLRSNTQLAALTLFLATSCSTSSGSQESDSKADSHATDAGDNHTADAGDNRNEDAGTFDAGNAGLWETVTMDTTDLLTSVHVAPDGTTWIAGVGGLRQFQEGQWSPWFQPPGPQGSRPVYDVFVNDNGIFASRTPDLFRFADGDWTEVGDWGGNCAWTEVRLTGAGEAVYAGCPYYSGFARWGDRDFALAQELLAVYDVQAVLPDTVYALGAEGIYIYDGFALGTDTRNDWQLLQIADALTYKALWADDTGRIVVAGDQGRVLHGDLSQLEEMESPSETTITALYGQSYDDLFAVGDAGAIWHFDGQKWQAMDSGTTANLHDIHGSSDGKDVWAVGDQGTVLRLVR